MDRDADPIEPYLELAREIRREVEQVVADDGADGAALAAAIDAVPERERARVAREVFDRLTPEAQWTVIERIYGDEEIREYLDDERAVRLEEVRRSAARDAVARAARVAGRLDLRDVAPGEQLVLGLFRAEDVRAAVHKGQGSDSCARAVVVRTTAEPGRVRVIDDVFNPRSGLFVTADYDETVWAAERLASHTFVTIGSEDTGPSPELLEPVLFPGARVDVLAGDDLIRGRLHLGFVTLGARDVFADPG